MGHLALFTKDIRHALARNTDLLEDLNVPLGWDTHMNKVDEHIEKQMVLDGDAVFWSSGNYQENDQQTVVSDGLYMLHLFFSYESHRYIQNDTATIYDISSSNIQ